MKSSLSLLLIAFLFKALTSLAQTSEEVADVATFEVIGNSYFGFIGNKIYKQESSNGKWEHIVTLPFAADGGRFSMKDRNTIVYLRHDDSLFYYRISDAKLVRKTQKELFNSFCANRIKKIIFSRAGYGDSPPDEDSMVYILDGRQFILAYKSPSTPRHDPFLSDNNIAIDQQVVAEFVKKIPAIYNKRATIENMAFTQEEYDTCKRNILAFKTFLESPESESKPRYKCAFYEYGKNLNFDKLLALVDTVRTIAPEYLNKFFWEACIRYEKDSWLVSWPRVKLVNAKDEVLEIRNGYDEPKTLYFPWGIELKGLYFNCYAFEINAFLNSAFPQFLGDSKRVVLIQELVKDLYERWEYSNKK